MTESPRVHVGVIDSGYPECVVPQLVHARSFVGCATARDLVGHGSRVIAAIASHAPNVEFSVAQVFGEQLRTQGETVAQALRWMVELGVRLVNLSLGVRQDYTILRGACEWAQKQGCVVVASVPALGAQVYPGAYAGVVRVRGDARCGLGQYSALGLPTADFGACVLPPDSDRRYAGASMACAHVTGFVAQCYTEEGLQSRENMVSAMARRATFIGPEIRAV